MKCILMLLSALVVSGFHTVDAETWDWVNDSETGCKLNALLSSASGSVWDCAGKPVYCTGWQEFCIGGNTGSINMDRVKSDAGNTVYNFLLAKNVPKRNDLLCKNIQANEIGGVTNSFSYDTEQVYKGSLGGRRGWYRVVCDPTPDETSLLNNQITKFCVQWVNASGIFQSPIKKSQVDTVVSKYPVSMMQALCQQYGVDIRSMLNRAAT